MARAIRLVAVALLLLTWAATAGRPAFAQADTGSVPTSEEELARLSDAELRALLLERLEAPQEEETGTFNPADTAFALQAALAELRGRLGEILGTYDQLPGALGRAAVSLVDSEEGSFARFAGLFALALAAGAAAELLVRRRTRAANAAEADAAAVFEPAAAEAAGPPALAARLSHAVAAAAGHFLLVALFSGVAATLFLVAHDGPNRERVTFAFYLAAIVVLRVIGGISRAYTAPAAPRWRIPAYSDGEARRVHTGVLATMAVGAFGFFTCSVFAVLGVHGDVHLLFLMSVGTLLTLCLAAAFLASRRAIAHDLGADGGWGEIAAGPTRRRIARMAPWGMAVGTLLIWCWLVSTSLLGGPPLFGAGLGTIGLLVLWPSLDAALAREALRTAATAGALTPAVLTVARVALAVVVLLLLAVAWRIDLTHEGSGLWAATVRSALEVGTVVLVAYAGWAALRLWIDRRIALEDAQAVSDGVDPAEAEIGGVGLSRMRTLLPLFKRAGQATILVIAVLVVLSSLGVAIAPVLAGAGVVGIAIGFGSQTLVRDIVSGAFFLMDDAFRLGEYIDLGSVQGSVEKINVRSLQLRHHRGALHTVPFGEITTLTNYSRDWAIMKLRFRVPFDTDVEKMRKVMKQVGKDLLTNPEIGQDFLQPLKSQGVVEVDDYGLIVRTKFMSKPGKQFLIRRHAYAAMQKALAENGIAFAKPEVRVSIDKPGRADDEALAEALEPAGAAALTAVTRGRTAGE